MSISWILFFIVIKLDSPPPCLTLAHAHGLGYGDVSEPVEAAVHDPGDAATHVQGPVCLDGVRRGDCEEHGEPGQHRPALI